MLWKVKFQKNNFQNPTSPILYDRSLTRFNSKKYCTTFQQFLFQSFFIFCSIASQFLHPVVKRAFQIYHLIFGFVHYYFRNTCIRQTKMHTNQEKLTEWHRETLARYIDKLPWGLSCHPKSLASKDDWGRLARNILQVYIVVKIPTRSLVVQPLWLFCSYIFM